MFETATISFVTFIAVNALFKNEALGQPGLNIASTGVIETGEIAQLTPIKVTNERRVEKRIKRNKRRGTENQDRNEERKRGKREGNSATISEKK